MALSDTDLIKLFRKGDSGAFDELIYKYDRMVLSIAINYTHNEDDAKDIYQDVFIRAFRGLKKFQFKSEFKTWLFRIATNVCLTYKSKLDKRKFVPIGVTDDDENNEAVVFDVVDNEQTPDVHYLNTEIGTAIEEAIETLTPKQKMSFILKHYHGYKIREIADIMECREGTIKKYLFDGTGKLKIKLLKYAAS